MNLSEAPMIFFTVVAQMCIGAFVALGIIQIFGRTKYSQRTIDRVTDPAVYAIGPAMVIGLIASMFHMHDVFHVFNVFRHWQSSWLTREIIFGILFAGFGFVFALMQWMRWGSGVLRQVVASLAALSGVGLLWSMSAIYASLRAVPAWHSWAVPFQFTMVAILLGCLLVCVALVIVNVVRKHRQDALEGVATKVEAAEEAGQGSGGVVTLVKKRVGLIHAPCSGDEWKLTSTSIQGLTFAASLASAAMLVSYPLYIAQLAGGDQTAQASAQVFSGGLFLACLILFAVAGIMLSFVSFWLARKKSLGARNLLAWVVSIAFVTALVASFISRMFHYEAMLRVGI